MSNDILKPPKINLEGISKTLRGFSMTAKAAGQALAGLGKTVRESSSAMEKVMAAINAPVMLYAIKMDSEGYLTAINIKGQRNKKCEWVTVSGNLNLTKTSVYCSTDKDTRDNLFKAMLVERVRKTSLQLLELSKL